jgi:antitoxin (DNA-binding transcriptional repressor) of toxin-antitoxin stability system
MQIVPIHQAKNQLSALIHSVEQGDSVFLTRHGRPVVQLSMVPAIQVDSKQEADISDALAKWEAFRDKVRPGPPLDWKKLRDAGRKY